MVFYLVFINSEAWREYTTPVKASWFVARQISEAILQE